MLINPLARSGVLAAVCIALASCGGGEEGTGALSLGITDAPVDEATAVVVKFTAIEVKPENGSAILFDIEDRSIDLLALAGGDQTLLLEDESLPAGRYNWMRLHVEATQDTQDGSYIDLLTGERFPLVVPSGSETGLKLVRGFTVAAGGRTDFTIDFDLRKSVVAPPGQSPNYMLVPALRILDSLQVGRIEGTVAQALVTPDCAPYVYVFSGLDVTPDDMGSASEVDPVISVPAALDVESVDYRYTVAFLEAGDYTVSFTCDGDADTPLEDEALVFTGTTNAAVTADQTTTVDFQPE